MKNDNVIICKNCGKEYEYEVQDWGYPGGKEREYAYCPYCNEKGYSAVTNGIIITRKTEEN